MKQKTVVAAGASLAALVGLAAIAQQQDGAGSVEGLTVLGKAVTAEEIATGRDIYAETCASCHGAKLEGQPDWKRRLDNGRMPAPPHDETGHTWHHSDRDLIRITKLGVGGVVPGYESDMPGFGGALSDAEIAAVLAYIKSTWPERQRTFQAQVTANSEGGS